MDSWQKEMLSRRYSSFASLLLYFLLGTYLPKVQWDDNKTIIKYIRENVVESIFVTISQGKEILALEEFPADWVVDLSNRFPFKMSNEATEQDCYNWVKWIVNTLKDEAKRELINYGRNTRKMICELETVFKL